MGANGPEPLQPRLGLLAPLLVASRIATRLGFGKHVARAALRRMFSERRKRRAFAGYTPTEHDVFVATYAKSGTNWMMQIAQQISWRGAAEFDHIHRVVPWPDAPGPSPVPLSDTRAREAAPTGLRLIKTHLETDYVPYGEASVYLTVIRDPKEVLVSSYWFLGGLVGVLGHVTIDDWFELFVAPGSLGSTWARHTAGYWSWRDRPNVFVACYGEILAEPRKATERVAGVMGVPLSDAELAEVVRRASFAYMKANESKFAPPRMPLMRESERPKMVRRGESGGTDELLSPAQQAAVDRLCQEELARLGSDFPYTEMFPLP